MERKGGRIGCTGPGGPVEPCHDSWGQAPKIVHPIVLEWALIAGKYGDAAAVDRFFEMLDIREAAAATPGRISRPVLAPSSRASANPHHSPAPRPDGDASARNAPGTGGRPVAIDAPPRDRARTGQATR